MKKLLKILSTNLTILVIYLFLPILLFSDGGLLLKVFAYGGMLYIVGTHVVILGIILGIKIYKKQKEYILPYLVTIASVLLVGGLVLFSFLQHKN